MSSAIRDFRFQRQRSILNKRISVAGITQARRPTNRLEQILVLAPVVLMPLEAGLPQISGFGVMFLVFAAQAAYVFLNRAEYISQIWQHPLLKTIYLFIAFGLFSEFTHSNSDYYELFRMIQNFGASIFLACLCRDRKTLQIAMYGYLIVGSLTSIVLLQNSYGALSSATATDYGEADRLRAAVFEDSPFEWNLNGLAFVAAQGAGVALALALTTRSNRLRYIFLGVGLMCFVGSFLPMSRSGVAILFGTCATVMFAYGVHRSQTMGVLILVGATLLFVVPRAVFSRLAFSTEADYQGRMEGRAAVYTGFFHHLPEVIMTGIGRGNFWGAWGKQSSFGNEKGRVSGAHNIFFQMTIYWGFPALIGLFAIIRQAYLCLPGKYGDDGLAIGLLCVAVSLLFWSLAVHNLYDKAFALGVGLLIAGQHWIYAPPVTPRQKRQRRRPQPSHP